MNENLTYFAVWTVGSVVLGLLCGPVLDRLINGKRKVRREHRAGRDSGRCGATPRVISRPDR